MVVLSKYLFNVPNIRGMEYGILYLMYLQQLTFLCFGIQISAVALIATLIVCSRSEAHSPKTKSSKMEFETLLGFRCGLREHIVHFLDLSITTR